MPAYSITSYLEVPAFVLLGIVAAAGVAVIFQLAFFTTDWFTPDVQMHVIAQPHSTAC